MQKPNRYSAFLILVFLALLLAQAFPLGQTISSQFDNFPAHDKLVSSVTEFRLWMGDRVFHDTLVGPNGWLVYATDRSMDRFQNVRPLTETDLTAYKKSLLEFQTLVEANGAKLFFVVAPYKNTVYPEYVPAEIPKIGAKSQVDQILNYLVRQSSIQVIDLRPAMFQAKQDAQVYYSTDTHWNDLGGFAAYQSILEALKPTFPQLSPHPISDFDISAQPPKVMDLSFIIGSKSLVEERVQLTPLFRRTSHADTMTLPSGRHVTFARTQSIDLPVALFFHDSFLYSVMPFLSEHFSRTFYVDIQAGNDMLPRAWVEQVRPDVVIIVLNEHFLDLLPELLARGRVVIE